MRKACISFCFLLTYAFSYGQGQQNQLNPQTLNASLQEIMNAEPIYPSSIPNDSISENYDTPPLPSALQFLDQSFSLKKDGGFSFRARPLINLTAGSSLTQNDQSFGAAAGLSLKMEYKNKLRLNGQYSYHGFNAFQFIRQKIENKRIFPGGSIADNKAYHLLNFNLEWMPSKYFTFSGGFDEHFIGRGYRSLMMSDAGYSHPFFEINTSVWNIDYSAMWISMKDIRNRNFDRWNDFENKFAAIHYLSWQITPSFRAGFFEAIVWQGKNEQGERGFEINYLNPVIFFRPVEFAIGSPDNAMMGVDMDFRFSNQLLYFQLMLDEFKFEEIKAMDGWWGNKQAFQLGWRSFDVFGKENLNMLAEYNYIRPFMYSHRTPFQSYGHYNQPLAHPAGANVMEALLHLTYSKNRWYVALKNSFSLYGTSPEGENYGEDIFLDYNTRSKEYNNFVGQGTENRLFNHQLEAAFLLSKENKLNAFARLTYRNHRVENTTERNAFLQIGITNMWGSPANSWVDY